MDEKRSTLRKAYKEQAMKALFPNRCTNSFVLAHTLRIVANRYPYSRKEMNRLCDLLELGCMTNDELQVYHHTPHLNPIFIQAYKRLGVESIF